MKTSIPCRINQYNNLDSTQSQHPVHSVHKVGREARSPSGSPCEHHQALMDAREAGIRGKMNGVDGQLR